MSGKYVIWKNRDGDAEFPWHFEGTEWGDTGSCRTFQDAVRAALGEEAS